MERKTLMCVQSLPGLKVDFTVRDESLIVKLLQDGVKYEEQEYAQSHLDLERLMSIFTTSRRKYRPKRCERIALRVGKGDQHHKTKKQGHRH